MKKHLILLVLFTGCVISGFAQQQITRFAVVDTARVYSTFFRDAQNVRDYEKKRADIQKKIDEMSNQIQELMQLKADAMEKDDDIKVLKYEEQINKKTEYLSEYANVKNQELANLKKKLSSNDNFYKMLYEEISKEAELSGYSMVMDIQNSDSILWYSQSVDITDSIISRLSSRKN